MALSKAGLAGFSFLGLFAGAASGLNLRMDGLNSFVVALIGALLLGSLLFLRSRPNEWRGPFVMLVAFMAALPFWMLG